MAIKVNINVEKDKVGEIFGISNERITELDRLTRHARIDSDNSMELLKKVTEFVDTLEELTLMTYVLGMKEFD